MSRPIEIVEVGPRDGLQNEKAVLEPVDQKLDSSAGWRPPARGASRRSPSSIPSACRRWPAPRRSWPPCRTRPGRSRIGLVLNERGWDRRCGRRCDEANVVVCATDGFGIRNQGARSPSRSQMLAASSAARRNAEGGPADRRRPSRWPSAARSTARSRRTRSSRSSRAAADAGRRRDRAGRHHRRRRPLDRAQAVEAARKAARRTRPAHALPRHPQHRPGQRLRQRRGRASTCWTPGRRPRRLPLRARRHRQHRHRGPGLHAGARRLRDRLRPRRPDRARPAGSARRSAARRRARSAARAAGPGQRDGPHPRLPQPESM